MSCVVVENRAALLLEVHFSFIFQIDVSENQNLSDKIVVDIVF